MITKAIKKKPFCKSRNPNKKLNALKAEKLMNITQPLEQASPEFSRCFHKAERALWLSLSVCRSAPASE